MGRISTEILEFSESSSSHQLPLSLWPIVQLPAINSCLGFCCLYSLLALGTNLCTVCSVWFGVLTHNQRDPSYLKSDSALLSLNLPEDTTIPYSENLAMTDSSWCYGNLHPLSSFFAVFTLFWYTPTFLLNLHLLFPLPGRFP